ncbi:Argininosuccinate lyase [compost metagenome]
MPHKKNPDVFELIRSRCNKIQALPNEIAMMITNLPSGYHRDLQLLKENLFPAMVSLNECLQMTTYMLQHISVKDNILADKKYAYLFSVEVVNDLALKGVPFREAYKIVGETIENGTFEPGTKVNHTHEGSIGNLCNAEITEMMEEVLAQFKFEKTHQAIEKLLA